jgi:hypothetical protein
MIIASKLMKRFTGLKSNGVAAKVMMAAWCGRPVNADIRGRSRATAHVSGGLNISGHQGRRGNLSRMRQRQ